MVWQTLKYYIVVFLLALGLVMPAYAEAYRLQAGDKVRLMVFGHADASGDLEVSADGNVIAPLVGAVPARGKTTAELTQTLTAALDADYLVDPKLTVELLHTAPFYILGQVKNPGSYVYREGMTVQQAVAMAGGFTSRAKTSEVLLTRGGGEAEGTSPDAQVRPGDTIEVERRWF